MVIGLTIDRLYDISHSQIFFRVVYLTCYHFRVVKSKLEIRMKFRSVITVPTKAFIDFASSTSLHGLQKIFDNSNNLNKPSIQSKLSQRLMKITFILKLITVYDD